MSETSKLTSDIQEYITVNDIVLSQSQLCNALSMYKSAYVWNICKKSFEIQQSILLGNDVTQRVSDRDRTKIECLVCGKPQYKGKNLVSHINKHLKYDMDAVDDVWLLYILSVGLLEIIMLVYYVKQSTMH